VNIVDGAGAWVARVDMAYLERHVVIEVDGYSVHSSKLAFDAGRDRWRKINDAGYRVLPFTANDIRRTPNATVAEVAAALGIERFGRRTAIQGVP
jgi:very-short-patch-repair endonuclease